MSLASSSLLNAARSLHAAQLARSFASSAARFQAEPVQKPVMNKEFKIYRWVCCIYLPSNLVVLSLTLDVMCLLESRRARKEADVAVVHH